MPLAGCQAVNKHQRHFTIKIALGLVIILWLQGDFFQIVLLKLKNINRL